MFYVEKQYCNTRIREIKIFAIFRKHILHLTFYLFNILLIQHFMYFNVILHQK